jgi:hypothetical protein
VKRTVPNKERRATPEQVAIIVVQEFSRAPTWTREGTGGLSAAGNPFAGPLSLGTRPFLFSKTHPSHGLNPSSNRAGP